VALVVKVHCCLVTTNQSILRINLVVAIMEVNPYPRWFQKLPDKYKPNSLPETNPYPRWLTKIGFCFFAFFFVVMLWDWYTIGVLVDQHKIMDYMYGGSISSTEPHAAEDYAQSSLNSTLFYCLPVLLLFALAIRMQTHFYRTIAFSAVVIGPFIFWAINS
jgi:hypothetical protein